MNHELQIAGQLLTVRSHADAEYVRGLAVRVEERVRRAEQQGATSVHAWMLVALGLADEAGRLRTELDTLRADVSVRVDELTDLFSSALAFNPGERGRRPAAKRDA